MSEDMIQDTLTTLRDVLERFKRTIRDKDVFIQVARVIAGSTFSNVALPGDGLNSAKLSQLDELMRRLVINGKPSAGCAIHVVPDGPDVYVVAIGNLSDSALSELAEAVARSAAEALAGPSLV